MADNSILAGFRDNFLQYVGVSEIFPEVTELIALERNLKMVNVQVAGAVRGVKTYGKEGTSAFRDLRISAKSYSGELETLEERTSNLYNSLAKQSVFFGTNLDTMLSLTKATSDYGTILVSRTASALAMFSEATGVSTYTLGEFTAKMLASGKLQEVEVEKYLTNILKVREQYGFATDDLYELFNITEKYANIVGTTGDKLKHSTGEMAKFIAIIKQTGLEARFATDLLDKMIDPTRAQENMVLLSKLGISMRDISFGDPTQDLENYLPKLKGLAEQILSTPGRLAQAKLAEVYGLTLEEVTKLSQMEVDRAEISRNKTLEQYRKETQSAVEVLRNTLDRIIGGLSWAFNNTFGWLMRSLGGFSILLLGPIWTALKNKARGFFGDVRASLTTSVSDGFSEGINKALIASERRYQEFLGVKKGVTPAPRSGGTMEDTMTKVNEVLYGKSGPTSTSFRAGRLKGQASRRKTTIDKMPSADELIERSRAETLRIEEAKLAVEGERTSGALSESEANKLLASLDKKMTEEVNKFKLLLQSSELRTQILSEMEISSTELTYAEESQKAFSVRIGLLNEELTKLKGEMLSLNEDEKEEQIRNIKLKEEELILLKGENERLVAEVQKRKAEIGGFRYSDIGFENLEGATSKTNAEVIAEYMGAGSGFSLKKAGIGIDKISSSLLSFLPRIGGSLGTLVGKFGPIATSLGMGGALGLVAVGVGSLIGLSRSIAKKNEAVAENEKRILSSVEAFKERAIEKLEPLGNIYAKMVESTANLLDNKKGFSDLENAIRVHYSTATTEDGRILSIIEKIGNNVALSTEYTKDTADVSKAQFKETVLNRGAGA